MNEDFEKLFIVSEERNNWLKASDKELLDSCRRENFKATGKGGQKRNKTSSAVRLTHQASGISVTASESRSQHDNCAKALKKLRMQIALDIRSDILPERPQLEISIKNPDFPIWTAFIFDLLYKHEFKLSEAADELEISSSKLIKLLAKSPQIWQRLSIVREKLQLPALRHPK